MVTTCLGPNLSEAARQVWLLRPVPLEEQVRQLLGCGAIQPALRLARLCAAQGAPWTQAAFAQSAFLLMNGAMRPSLLPL